jgi:hypothetical protein
MYKSRLDTAPCQAVFEKAPVTLTILLFKETIRYNLRMYCKSATRKSVSLLCPDQEYLIAGITDQVMICIKRTKEMSDESKYGMMFPSTFSKNKVFFQLTNMAHTLLWSDSRC